MAVAEIVITPLGTGSPSLSKYVAKVHRVLDKYQVKYQLTPMSTVIEADVDTIFKIAREMHEVLFSEGVQRVVTSLRVDDRRDKELTMEGKVRAVEEKLKG